MPHPSIVVLMAALLAGAMASIENRSAKERFLVAARVFVCCLGTVAAGSWLMYWIHG